MGGIPRLERDLCVALNPWARAPCEARFDIVVAAAAWDKLLTEVLR